ncbi:MAG: LptA/OstA family protein [Desulfobacterales bacterium]
MRLFLDGKTQKIISCLLICFFSCSILFLSHTETALAAKKIQKPKKSVTVKKTNVKAKTTKKTQKPKQVESVKKVPVTADTAPKIQKPEKDESAKKIHITADKLIAEGNSNNAEFIGNVRAVQETTVITSDKLKIFYKKDSSGIENNPKGEDSIKEIVATGNVKILFDDKTAETEQAVYTAETRILVLNGPNSKITSGKNTISGSKITFFRDDGRINVEGGGKNRVEAFFESDGKSL